MSNSQPDDVPACEVCGQPATAWSLDTLVMLRPVLGSDGRWWSNQTGEGGHYRCAAHPYREGVRTRYSAGYQQWEQEQRRKRPDR